MPVYPPISSLPPSLPPILLSLLTYNQSSFLSYPSSVPFHCHYSLSLILPPFLSFIHLLFSLSSLSFLYLAYPFHFSSPSSTCLFQTVAFTSSQYSLMNGPLLRCGRQLWDVAPKQGIEVDTGRECVGTINWCDMDESPYTL